MTPPVPALGSGASEDGRTRRAEAKRKTRRTGILEAALRAFGSRGYHDTSVSDILSEAGIARGTFYLYFESKNAVFGELLDQLLVRLGDSIDGVDTADDAAPMEEQLTVSIRRVLKTVVDNRLLSKVIIREAVGLDREIDRRLAEFYGRLLVYLRISLEEGQRMGVIRELDTEVASMCILGSIKQFMEQFVMSDVETHNVDHMALAVLDFNLRGILRPPG